MTGEDTLHLASTQTPTFGLRLHKIVTDLG
jgi:hypothetical protein